MFDAGELPVLTFGNCILTIIKWFLKLHTYTFLTLLRFLKIQKYEFSRVLSC